MTQLRCHRCHQVFAVERHHLASLHHTSDGLVGYVRCPEGHLSVVALQGEVRVLGDVQQPLDLVG